MTVSEEQVEKILTTNISLSQMGFSLMVTRLKNIYKNNPTVENLKLCTNEINALLSKYQSVLRKDFETISKL